MAERPKARQADQRRLMACRGADALPGRLVPDRGRPAGWRCRRPPFRAFLALARNEGIVRIEVVDIGISTIWDTGLPRRLGLARPAVVEKTIRRGAGGAGSAFLCRTPSACLRIRGPRSVGGATIQERGVGRIAEMPRRARRVVIPAMGGMSETEGQFPDQTNSSGRRRRAAEAVSRGCCFGARRWGSPELSAACWRLDAGYRRSDPACGEPVRCSAILGIGSVRNRGLTAVRSGVYPRTANRRPGRRAMWCATYIRRVGGPRVPLAEGREPAL